MTKDFKGHFEPADPRNVLWGAGGADWPTVPPYRIRLGMQNPTGDWDLLRSAGVLFEADPAGQHDDVTYTGQPPFPNIVTGMWLWRHFDPEAQRVWWLLFIAHPDHHEDLQIDHTFDPGPANVTVILPNEEWVYHETLYPGTPFEIWQVYFNETQPPEGWPPWA